jgi:alpha-glucosidase (family GH31 glycosyl hydrolase)
VFFFGVPVMLPVAGVADPGNVISWFSNSLNELTFTCQTAVVILDVLDPNVVRVRMEPSGTPFDTNVSYTVVKSWVLPPISVTDISNLTTVATSGLQVNVQKLPFRLTFSQTNGTVWLTESNTTGLASTPSGSITNLYDEFATQSSERFYGLGLVLGDSSLSYGGGPGQVHSRTLYNARSPFEGGYMTDMAVPWVLSTKGYGLFMDNTFRQTWLFSAATWVAEVTSGELNYYFIAATNPADALNRYTQITGTAPIPPRWALGYMQSRYGYRNWSQMYSALGSFRTNDLPCDTLILDLYWYGSPEVMGGLTWDPTNFPNPSSNLAVFASSGIKVINIQEEYINNFFQPALSNFDAAAALGYLVSTNASMTSPSIQVNEGFYDTAGYVDYSNPSARGWWWGLIQPLYDAGIAGFWTDLGEPEEDTTTDYLYGGHRELEMHNIYNYLWHQSLAEGFASNYPNARLYILSRSGFAGDQRFGAGHWTNDTAPDWPTLAAHPIALGNYGLSGLSYFGSDIGGFLTPQPTDELYVRWFQFGSFCPIFRAHGLDSKPTAPYEFDLFVQDHCRNAVKLRYRLLPYVYTAARETFDTGMPMCRALPLAFPTDANVVLNGNQFMFGSNIMVSPVVTQSALWQPTYLPAGNWIDLWGGQPLTGPVTTNWPAQIGYTPVFYRDNTITPLGPYVESSQFDDGSQRGVRVYCSTNASFTLYDDDGASNGYRSNQFATTFITAAAASNAVLVDIGQPAGSYSGEPTQRAWQVELYCTNAVASVIADGASLSSYTSAESLVAAGNGYYMDAADHLLRAQIPAAPITQAHVINCYLNLTSPPPYEARINAGGRPYLDQGGALWVEDRPYTAGSFGINGGTSNMVPVAIANTADQVLFQSEHLGPAFSAFFDCPDGIYETSLDSAETLWNAPGQRLFNVSIQGHQVLTNYDIFAAAGGSNTATMITFTNNVLNGQLEIDFAGVTTMWDSNACVSGIRVRKIADLDTDSDGDGIPDWWRLEYFGHVMGQTNDNSMAYQDADGTGQDNLFKYVAGLDPTNPASVFVLNIASTNQPPQTSLFFAPPALGRIYTPQYSTDLVSGIWIPLTTYIGPVTNISGNQVSVIDTNPVPPQEFYRIRITANGAMDVSAQISVVRSGFRFDFATSSYEQTVTLQNTGSTSVAGPLSLVLDHLSANASLANANGVTTLLPPLGSPYVNINLGAGGVLGSGATASVTLEFSDLTMAGITYTARVLSGAED